jgi:hypothetical protein
VALAKDAAVTREIVSMGEKGIYSGRDGDPNPAVVRKNSIFFGPEVCQLLDASQSSHYARP